MQKEHAIFTQDLFRKMTQIDKLNTKKQARYLNELAKGRKMEKILRQ